LFLRLYNSKMTKYVLANVEVPIQINENGSIETMQSYAKIHIIKPLSSPDDLQSKPLPVQEQIDNLFKHVSVTDDSCDLHEGQFETTIEKEEISENQEEPVKEKILTVLREEIKLSSRKPIKNTSFKSKKVFRHNRTAKLYV